MSWTPHIWHRDFWFDICQKTNPNSMKSNNKLKLNLFFTTNFEILVSNQNHWKPENTELKVGNSILYKLCLFTMLFW
jgi:hypothetical protein